ncbi:MAG: winged helix-turn-helix domain-containing protein [Leptospirales bacterium]
MKTTRTFKDAAKYILEENNRAMHTNEITELALEKGILITDGQTPSATMGAQLYQDTKYNSSSIFERAGRGLFLLKSKTGNEPISPGTTYPWTSRAFQTTRESILTYGKK